MKRSIANSRLPFKKRRITPYSPKLETRFYNKTISHTTAATTIAVNDVPAGTGSSDRTGRKVMCKSVEINIEATSSAAAGVRPDPVRVVLYSPKQSGDVWTPAAYNSPIANDRYWVIMDRYIDFVSTRHMTRTIKQVLGTEFSDTAGTIRKGELYLSLRGPASTTTTATGWTKLWFIDN